MKFDSNGAWLDAMAAVRANRQVLLAVAGVFFLLPTLLSTVFLTDVQTQILEAMNKPETVESIFSANLGLFLIFGLGGMLVQVIGYLTVMTLLSDRGRPTVGEAIVVALRALPTMIGIFVLTMAATLLASMVFGLVLGALFGIILGTSVASAIVAVALIIALVYASIKLSLVVPVVVNEGLRNPVAAMVRSWQLTRHNSLRLFGFFVLLTIGYIAVAFMTTVVLVGPVALILGQGDALTFYTGVISGVISAVTSVIFIAVLAFTHRQLAGPSPETISETFE